MGVDAGLNTMTGRVDISTGDVRTGRRERARHHPAHAARRTSDERRAARKQLLFCHETHLPVQGR